MNVTTLDDLRKVADATRWKLVILHPRPEVRQQGCNAYYDKASIESNPYHIGTAEHANWEQGYRDGMAQES